MSYVLLGFLLGVGCTSLVWMAFIDLEAVVLRRWWRSR